MSDSDINQLIEVYRAYIEDVNELRASRLGENAIRVTIVTLFLGAQAFIASSLLSQTEVATFSSFDLQSWLPVLAIAVIGYLGFRFSRNWAKLMRELTQTIGEKFTHLRLMEEKSDALRNAGGVLFIEEYKKRHPDYTPPINPSATSSPVPPSPASSAISRPAIPNSRKPVRGAGLSAIELSTFFQALFRTTIFGILVAKGLAVGIYAVTSFGWFAWLSHLIGF